MLNDYTECTHDFPLYTDKFERKLSVTVEDSQTGLQYTVFDPSPLHHCRFFVIWRLSTYFQIWIYQIRWPSSQPFCSRLVRSWIQKITTEAGYPDWGIFMVFISESRNRIWSQVLQLMYGHSENHLAFISFNSNVQVTN
jgi:hypothetical protein